MGEKISKKSMADELCEGMQCTDHPYRTNPGGICAFCLQDKLGKLVSSSKFSDPFFSAPPPPPSSSSSPPILPSKPRHRKPKPKPPADPLLTRSKSMAPPSDTPRKKTFWSFLTLSSTTIPISKRRSTSSTSSSANCASELHKPAKEDETLAGNDDASPSGSHASSSFGRKVARSRSVGCGSRSFSGDFLERISNGFGDCTLRRVESHRESKQKVEIYNDENEEEEQRIKERIKCGGMFVGLGVTTYWLSATAAANACGQSVRLPAARRSAPHGRSKSWGWAFSSPMRAFRPGGGSGQTTIVAGGGRIATAGGGGIH